MRLSPQWLSLVHSTQTPEQWSDEHCSLEVQGVPLPAFGRHWPTTHVSLAAQSELLRHSEQSPLWQMFELHWLPEVHGTPSFALVVQAPSRQNSLGPQSESPLHSAQ